MVGSFVGDGGLVVFQNKKVIHYFWMFVFFSFLIMFILPSAKAVYINTESIPDVIESSNSVKLEIVNEGSSVSTYTVDILNDTFKRLMVETPYELVINDDSTEFIRLTFDFPSGYYEIPFSVINQVNDSDVYFGVINFTVIPWNGKEYSMDGTHINIVGDNTNTKESNKEEKQLSTSLETMEVADVNYEAKKGNVEDVKHFGDSKTSFIKDDNVDKSTETKETSNSVYFPGIGIVLAIITFIMYIGFKNKKKKEGEGKNMGFELRRTISS